MRRWQSAIMLLAILPLAACDASDAPGDANQAGVVEDRASDELAPADAPIDGQIGTPLEERVATLGILNKRNNLSQDIELSPGQTQRVGDVEVTLQSCERTAPWEMRTETGAFVQVAVRGRGQSGYDRIFSGWLFKNSPSINVVEHPIYDVWVKDCAMSFPGEE